MDFQNNPPSSSFDIHQHIWTEPLIDALSRRNHPPYVRRAHGGWTLTAAGEQDSHIGPAEIDAEFRLAELAAAGIDRAVIAPSSPIGLEDLPVSEARPLLDAHLAGVRALPDGFRHWAVSSVWRIDPDFVDAQLDAGAVGLALPAGALSAPEGFARTAPLLDLLEARRVPLFVHPGPGPYSELAVGEPQLGWWPALTRYVAEMNAAWYAFAAAGRERHPSLRVVFAMLAGLAPLHGERFTARGGEGRPQADELVFYDTSSYGPRAIESVASVVGPSQIVYGSDAPVISEAAVPPTLIDRDALVGANPARLFGLEVAR